MNHLLRPAQGALIIAEVGNNHEGNFEVARRLVRMAAESGADAVKFQTFRTEGFINRRDEARFKRLKGFELSYPQFTALSKLARSLGLLFLSTPLDLGSVGFLAGIVDAFKIASGDNDCYPFIARAGKTDKPVFISTGVSDLSQVRRTAAFARKNVRGGLALLHCVSAYPVEPQQANLRSIPFLAQRLPDIPVGYSDHTIGIEACVLAAALGARIIEKHFTLDKAFSDFRDHQLSADPQDLRELVRRVRQAEALLGLSEKRIQPCEAPNAVLIRRSAVAAKDLPRGRRLSPKDILWLRPGGGVPPSRSDLLLGRRLNRTVPAGEPLRGRDVSR